MPVLTTVVPALTPSTIAVGQSVTATVKGLNQSGFPIDLGAVVWTSSDPTVATVSTAGAVTGVANGTTRIIATSGGIHGEVVVTVSVPIPTLTSLAVTLGANSVPVLGTTTATASGLDQNGASMGPLQVIWTTSNPANASITPTGTITGLAVGTTQIVAISGGVQAQKTLTVTPIAVASVTVSPSSTTILLSGTVQLTAKLLDAGGNVLSGRVVTWSSSDTTKATVSATGLVTPVAFGVVTITATSEGKTGTSVVTVSSGVSTVVMNTATTTMIVNSTMSATATVHAVAGVSTAAKFVSSNVAVATVTNVGNVVTVTAVGAGSATIIASAAADSTKTAALAVTVDLYGLNFTVQPANSIASASIAPAIVVTIKDGSGATVAAAANNVTLAIGSNPGNSALNGTVTVAAVAGVATFPAVNLNKIGVGYTLVASSAGIVPATSSAFSVAVGPPTQIVVAQQPTTTFVNTSIAPSPQFLIEDVGGNLVVGAANNVTVAIGANPGGAVLGGTVTVAAVGGIATFPNLSLNVNGVGYTLTAAAAGLTGATTSAFNITGPFQFVSSGSATTCGVMTYNTVYCWGDNGGGALGTGIAIGNANTPRQIAGIQIFTSLGAGGQFFCGATPTNTAYCWGSGPNGELGNGIGGSSTSPVQVSGAHTWATVNGSCGVDAAGAAFCWGDNSFGQIGNNTIVKSLVPTAVSGGLVWAKVTSGIDGHTCGVTVTGVGYCWGNNSLGQIGDGTTINRKVPTLISGGIVWASLSPGASNQTCGVSTGNVGYCWGANTNGLLGAGIGIGASWPTPLGIGSFSQISAGGSSNCGVGAAGAAFCWGANDAGQIGDGTNTNTAVPVAVTGGLTFANVSVAFGTACGITTTGVQYCWGTNAVGQFGSGNYTSSKTPVRGSTPP